MSRRFIVRDLVMLVTLAGFWAFSSAQPAPRYAVMSLLGDRLTVIGEEPQTGTLIKKNSEESMELSSDAFDQVAMRLAVQSIVKSRPSAKAVALRAGETKYYAAQDDYVDGKKANLPAAILGALKSADVTHLVLLTKRRSDANIELAYTRTGHGSLRGLGYYVNRWSKIRIVGTSEEATGFLAAFASFNVTLIDLETQAVLKSVPISRSKTVSHSSSTVGKDPWEALNDKDRLELLGTVLTAGVEEGLSALMATP